MNCHHLSIEERSCIRKYYVDGLSCREVARLIGRNAGTVPREIRRNCARMTPRLAPPHTAHKKYLPRCSCCHRGIFHSQEVIDCINGRGRLKATWSPEQIARVPCELKMPGWRTIYR
ncbi:MAG: helix-turn-helix domain-containing protein [Oscillospiraceae bacterium]|nr:MAG: helix-turn-helix domain-containing protein [Oscillospiraceae bacterium]